MHSLIRKDEKPRFPSICIAWHTVSSVSIKIYMIVSLLHVFTCWARTVGLVAVFTQADTISPSSS